MDGKSSLPDGQKGAGNSPSAPNVNGPHPVPGKRLHKGDILRGHEAFREIYRRGERIASDCLILFFMTRQVTAKDKAGCTVGFAVKRVPTNVRRNYIRRVLRENYREHKPTLESLCRQAGIEMRLVIHAEVNRIEESDIFMTLFNRFSLLIPRLAERILRA